MSRLIDLELKTGTLWLSFPYDATVVAAVKTLPGRRFDSSSKRWAVPLEHATVVVERMQELHFRLTPRMRDWWLDERDEEAPRTPNAGAFEVDPADGYTISRLNDAARGALREAFGDDVWVVAEIDGFDDRNAPTGHAYFELVERLRGGGDPIAKVGAVLFASRRRAIERKLTDEIDLRDGLRVRFKGKVELYAPQGRYQFIVEDIDADWSMGAMRRKREQILAALKKRGILERNVERPVPVCPLRVGLITSVDSDAYNDFVHELERSELGFHVTAHHANVQGRNTEESVIAALGWFSERRDHFDVVAIVRGGGSRSDLSYFDTMAIGEAVCGLEVKVVAGVGHHRDRCVLDFVAHSEKTPTAAAQLLVRRARAFLERVDRSAGRVAELSGRRTERAWRRLERGAAAWQMGVSERLYAERRRFSRVVSSLESASRRATERNRKRLSSSAHGLERGARRAAAAAEARVELAARELDPVRLERHVRRVTSRLDDHRDALERAVAERLGREGLRLEHLQAKLRLSDPRRILERGFAIVRDDADRIVTDADRLRTLQLAHLQMRDGTVAVLPTTEEDDDD
jgi:exodeoxyribonuclease VII large subunit